MNFYKAGLVRISAVLLFCAAGIQAEMKPNIIVIFTDDQGCGDLGCCGPPTIKTPNIN